MLVHFEMKTWRVGRTINSFTFLSARLFDEHLIKIDPFWRCFSIYNFTRLKLKISRFYNSSRRLNFIINLCNLRFRRWSVAGDIDGDWIDVKNLAAGKLHFWLRRLKLAGIDASGLMPSVRIYWLWKVVLNGFWSFWFWGVASDWTPVCRFLWNQRIFNLKLDLNFSWI